MRLNVSAVSVVSAESGRGQPHSKTLSRWIARYSFREVLECGCPLPLWMHRDPRALLQLVQPSRVLAILDCAFAVIHKISPRRSARIGAAAHIFADVRESKSGTAIPLRPDLTPTIQTMASDAFRGKRPDAEVALPDRRIQRCPRVDPC